MRVNRSALGLGVCCLWLGSGCAGTERPVFVPPGGGAPYAIVEVRTHYALPLADGRIQREAVFVEGLHVIEPVGRIPGGYTRTVRVPPGAAIWTIDALDSVMSAHLEDRQSPFLASCGMNSVCLNALTSEVRVNDHVPLAGCTRAVQITVESGEHYALDYGLGGMGMCDITCSRQTSSSGGAELVACPSPPPRPQTSGPRPLQ